MTTLFEFGDGPVKREGDGRSAAGAWVCAINPVRRNFLASSSVLKLSRPWHPLSQV